MLSQMWFVTLENKILKLTVEATRFPGPPPRMWKGENQRKQGKEWEIRNVGERAEENDTAGAKDGDLPLVSYDRERPDVDGE